MPVSAKFSVLMIVLAPSPKVSPIRFQSMASTIPLNVLVMAFTASVIFWPRLSQLIRAFAVSKAWLTQAAMACPTPS